MDRKPGYSQRLAEDITRAASSQTYYTIRLLADRERLADAYRAYAYFRWVDDCLDAETGAPSEAAFLQRQQQLLADCYRLVARGGPLKKDVGQAFSLPGQAESLSYMLLMEVCAEEQMLVDLVAHDTAEKSGLRAYLDNMMGVMAFDVARRGRSISQAELAAYTRMLAVAVTEALYYFIGHNCPSPCDESRYMAVQGAHVIHMLRDMAEDAQVGYFNLPREIGEAHGISLQDVDRPAYRKWVRGRVALANAYFRTGLENMARVKNWRCRLAGFAYIARFEWMANAIERDGYRLRAAYPERKSIKAGLWMVARVLAGVSGLYRPSTAPHKLAVQPIRYEEK